MEWQLTQGRCDTIIPTNEFHPVQRSRQRVYRRKAGVLLSVQGKTELPYGNNPTVLAAIIPLGWTAYRRRISTLRSNARNLAAAGAWGRGPAARIARHGVSLLSVCSAVFAGPSTSSLTRISDVKALTPIEADTTKAVRLRGVVTVSLGSRKGAFLQDETGGIFIGPRKGHPFVAHVGDWVECRGTTAAGLYASKIDVDAIEHLGRREIPVPAQLGLADLSAGAHDAEWVETRGIVRSTRMSQDNWTEIRIAVGRERLHAIICDPSGVPPDNLIDSEVRLWGVASGYFNPDRQLLFPILFVPDWNHLVVTRTGCGDPFDAPLRSTNSLFRYAPYSTWGQICKVRGVVTHYLPGRAVFLRDQDGPLYAETATVTRLKPGDIVELAGFPANELRGAYLDDAVCRTVGTAPQPEPVRVEIAAIVQGRIKPAELVSLEGMLLESTRLRNTLILTLKSDERSFEVHLDAAAEGSYLNPPQVESRLRVTGVLWTEMNELKGRQVVSESFRLLSRYPSDIVVLQRASWLTRGRLAQIAWALLMTIILALVWIWLLRRRVETQAALIADKITREAVTEERARMACEVHDTLAQSFSAVGFQLEALAQVLENPPLQARLLLDRALKMLRHSHDDVRHSLKQLRDPAITRKPLAMALRETLERGGGAFTANRICFMERGKPFPLPPVTEHNILRVGQEAATNAVKHAQAGHLEIELSFASDEVRLRVVDDGCGFDEDTLLSSDHFGLQIMRERARRIGARLQIHSRRGVGTQILLSVPLAGTPKPGRPAHPAHRII